MGFSDKLTALPFVVDGRKTLPRHKTKQWGKRDPAQIIGACLHQSLSAEGRADGVAAYHVGPNHMSPDGLPGLAYTLFVERSGIVILGNDVEDRTWSQGDASIRGDENAEYLAICFGGNFSGPGYTGTQVPTPGQIHAFNQLWPALKDIWGWKATGLYGHYNFGKPDCPGTVLQSMIEAVRKGEYDFDDHKLVAVYNYDLVDSRQHALAQLGYYHGSIDGIWGIQCRAALCAFQEDHGLLVDGVWGPKTTAVVEKLV